MASAWAALVSAVVMYNLSLWYKLVDKTMFGAWFPLIGFIVTLVINIVFIPLYSYMASAWAALVSAVVMVILSYVYGQKYYPIHYKLKTLGLYFGLTMLLLGAMYLVTFECTVVNIVFIPLYSYMASAWTARYRDWEKIGRAHV